MPPSLCPVLRKVHNHNHQPPPLKAKTNGLESPPATNLLRPLKWSRGLSYTASPEQGPKSCRAVIAVNKGKHRNKTAIQWALYCFFISVR